MKYLNVFFLAAISLSGCTNRIHQRSGPSSGETAELNLIPVDKKMLAPGIPVYDSAVITYRQKDRPALNVRLGEPVIVAMATKKEEWGHYQFPSIAYGLNGGLIAKINLSPDAVESYGRGHYLYSYSGDGGKTWSSDKVPDSADLEVDGSILLPSGDRIKITTPTSINEKQLKLPKPVGITGNNLTLYRLHDLPASRQGVFMSRLHKGGSEWVAEQASLTDPQALRYSIKGEIPVVWWGDVKIASDGSLIAGIYPGYYLKEDGTPDLKSGVFFYRSTDEGHSWKIQGRIPYEFDPVLHPGGERLQGFTEPAFEILDDGSFLCVMRTTDNEDGPMYTSRSIDMGVNWTKPAVITPAGVLPRMLQLDNGVLVLSSGRPGVQLRFSTDGKGEVWSHPFEMLPYDRIGRVDWWTSCGYTYLVPAGTDSFVMIYSDFFTMTGNGEMRKSIKVRKVTVKPI